jgi:hypothetical protein
MIWLARVDRSEDKHMNIDLLAHMERWMKGTNFYTFGVLLGNSEWLSTLERKENERTYGRFIIWKMSKRVWIAHFKYDETRYDATHHKSMLHVPKTLKNAVILFLRKYPYLKF